MFNHKLKIGLGVLVAVLLAIPMTPSVNAQVPGVSAPPCSATFHTGVGQSGTNSTAPNGYHYVYTRLPGFEQSGCLEDATTDTNGFTGSAGSDDTFNVGQTLLYSRGGSRTTEETTVGSTSFPDTAHCGTAAFPTGCKYTSQGDGVGSTCQSILATPHHSADKVVFVHDANLGGRVSFSIYQDWARQPGNAPGPGTPVDRLSPSQRALIQSLDPTATGGSEGIILQEYDANVRTPPTAGTPGPGNNPPGACGDKTVEPCPSGVDENVIDPVNNPNGCNELDHIWSVSALGGDCTSHVINPVIPGTGAIQADPVGAVLGLAGQLEAYILGETFLGIPGDVAGFPACITASAGSNNFWNVGQAGATNDGVTVNTLADVAGADGTIAVNIDGPTETSLIQVWSGS